MDEKILTKEEYTEKVNNLVKPMIEFAMSTSQFNDRGCYAQEFVKIGDREATFMVMNKDWMVIPVSLWNDLHSYKSMYYRLQQEYEELKEKSRKKFLGIINL